MDLRILFVAAVCITHCALGALLSPMNPESGLQDYDKMSDENGVSLKQLDQALRDDIIQELRELADLERHLKASLFKAQNKKRQLEIRKREPVQCLVNVVSCWRK